MSLKILTKKKNMIANKLRLLIFVLSILFIFMSTNGFAKNNYLICKTKLLQGEGAPDLFFEIDYKLNTKKKTIEMLSSRSWGGLGGEEKEWDINESLKVIDWSDDIISAQYITEYGIYTYYTFLINNNLLIRTDHNPYGDLTPWTDIYGDIERYVEMQLWKCEK